MKTYTEKELKAVLKIFMESEKGKAVSDADRAYKRGWRDCIRGMREYLKKIGTEQ